MMATREEMFNMLDTVFAFTRLSNINQSLQRPFSGGETLFISEIYFLHLIGGKGRTTVTELARETYRTLSAASQIVSKLHRKGLVDKTACPSDKKVVLLSLTDRGRRILAEHQADDERYYDEIVSVLHDFSREDVQKVERLIEALKSRTLFAIQGKKGRGGA